MKYIILILSLTSCVGRLPFDYLETEISKLDTCKKINTRFKEVVPNLNDLKTLHNLINSMGTPNWTVDLSNTSQIQDQLDKYNIDISFNNTKGVEYHYLKILYTTVCYHYVFLVVDNNVDNYVNLIKDPNGEQIWKDPSEI